MSSASRTVEQVLASLSQAPKRIAAASSGFSPALLRHRPSANDWSVNDVLAHLRACADVRGDFITRMLTEEHPTLRAISPITWMKTKTDYPDLEFAPSFRAFRKQRSELLAALESLPPKGWARSATVKGAGKVVEHTVLFYAEWLIDHEKPHLKQIEEVAARLQALD